MIRTLRELTAAAPIELRVAVVEYRDHPPRGSHLRRPGACLQSRPGGGPAGDRGAAGRMAAATRRRRSMTASAPRATCSSGSRTATASRCWSAAPHAARGRAAQATCFPRAVPAGWMPTRSRRCSRRRRSRSARAPDALGKRKPRSQGCAARFTGGESYPVSGGEAAIESFKGLLSREFADLDFDRQVLAAVRCQAEWTVDDVCRAVDGTPGPRSSASLCRLGLNRRLLGQA